MQCCIIYQNVHKNVCYVKTDGGRSHDQPMTLWRHAVTSYLTSMTSREVFVIEQWSRCRFKGFQVKECKYSIANAVRPTHDALTSCYDNDILLLKFLKSRNATKALSMLYDQPMTPLRHAMTSCCTFMTSWEAFATEQWSRCRFRVCWVWDSRGSSPNALGLPHDAMASRCDVMLNVKRNVTVWRQGVMRWSYSIGNASFEIPYSRNPKNDA